MHLAIQIVKSITLAGIIKLVVLLLSNLSCKLLEILVLLKKKYTQEHMNFSSLKITF